MHPGGRPSKYDPSFVDKVDQYVLTCGREQTRMPKRVDVALLLEVTEDTLNNWAKDHEEFLGALTRVDMLQKSQLMDDGMYGGKEVNPNIARFLLSVNHGMMETSRQVLGGEIDATTGKQQPLFVNAGNGFLPATVTLQQVSTGSASEPQSEVQGSSMASEGSEDLHSDNGVSKAGTS